MSSEIKTAITALFSCVDIPTDRIRANKLYSQLRQINASAKTGKSLALEQLEWLTDTINDKTKEMYPDRYTDLSTPLLREELTKLEMEKRQVTALLYLVESLAHETEVRIPFNNVTKPTKRAYFEAQVEGV